MALDKERLRRAVEEQRRRGGAAASNPFVERPSAPPATESVGPRATQEANNSSSFWKPLGVIGIIIFILWNLFSGKNTSSSNTTPQQAVAVTAPSPAQAARPPNSSQPLTYQRNSNYSTVTPSASQDAPKQLSSIPDLRNRAADLNSRGIDSALSLAITTSDKEQILQQAIAAGRDFDFRSQPIERNRRFARSLHDSVIGVFSRWPPEPGESCTTLEEALAGDPLDSEISGNLAICYVRAGQADLGRQQAIYSLSLPKASNSSGRTADWVTLSAAYATAGDQVKARAAMFVALAGVDDPVKRCSSARYSIKNTFGPVLKPATSAMFDRIQEIGLTSDVACSMPLE